MIELYDWDINKLEDNYTVRDNEYLIYNLPFNCTYYIRIFGENTGSPYDLRWGLREDYTEMIPCYNILFFTWRHI